MLRSILAVIAGIVVLSIASFAIEGVISVIVDSRALGQQVWFRMLTMGYTLVCVGAGGHVAAWVARRMEAGHALILGGIQVVFTIGAMMQLRQSEPRWTWIVGIALIMPAAWLGGMIRARPIR